MQTKKLHDHMFIFAEKLLSKFFSKAYINFFERAIIEEFKMVGIKENDKLIHIGCGPLPNTLISLAKNIKAKYVGIDKDKEAVEIAKKIVEKYALDIKIEEGNALNYPINDFDIIVVSFGVEPRNQVFERIRKDCKKNARIVFRKQWDFLDAIFGKKDLPDGFEVISQHKRRDFIKSYLLKPI
ncbi:MAG: class I SAM-dependent methyltransferase [Candidatus Thermoplasmatota archaeon]